MTWTYPVVNEGATAITVDDDRNVFVDCGDGTSTIDLLLPNSPRADEVTPKLVRLWTSVGASRPLAECYATMLEETGLGAGIRYRLSNRDTRGSDG